MTVLYRVSYLYYVMLLYVMLCHVMLRYVTLPIMRVVLSRIFICVCEILQLLNPRSHTPRPSPTAGQAGYLSENYFVTQQ